MLPKGLRLGKKEGFDAIFRSKKAIFGQEIALFFRSRGFGPVRIGFAFKQKAFPLAIERHFLKRQGSAIMKGFASRLPEGFDFIVLFHRRPEVAMEYATLRTKMKELIDRCITAKR